ncbi:MAG: MBL fold metallo-hydrolase [Proteobacteria bacterium]|nr:MBL fold metallo-hydrolase [Pseudomonadota bacterium]
MRSKFSENRRQFLRWAWWASLISLLPSKASAQSAWHDQDGGFRNNYIPAIDKPLADVRRAFAGERPPLLNFPLATNSPEQLRANKTQTTVTWIGHCTILLQIQGLNILTDPHFTERASPFTFVGPKRGTPPGMRLDDLPPIDIILVSHNHYDHLDFATQLHLAKHSPQAHVFVPLGLKQWFKGKGFAQVTERDWWEEVTYKGARLTAIPTQHWSRRGLLDSNKTLWCGWTVQTDDFSFAFLGDSGYSKDYIDIKNKFGGFDLAAIPIGAYAPRWFMQDVHQNPEEAVQCLQDLGARRGLATHWGTFQLTFEPMDEPPQRLATAMTENGIPLDDFMVLKHGETRIL